MIGAHSLGRFHFRAQLQTAIACNLVQRRASYSETLTDLSESAFWPLYHSSGRLSRKMTLELNAWTPLSGYTNIWPICLVICSQSLTTIFGVPGGHYLARVLESRSPWSSADDILSLQMATIN